MEAMRRAKEAAVKGADLLLPATLDLEKRLASGLASTRCKKVG